MRSEKPISDHITDFLEYCEIERGLSNNTLISYARSLACFSNWLAQNGFTGIKPHELGKNHIWKYRLHLARKANIKKQTQNTYLTALRRLLAFFAKRDLEALPPEAVELPKLRDAERAIKYLTLEQVGRLLNSIKTKEEIGLRDRAILETLFSTGLRVSELAALDRENLNIARAKKEGILEIVINGKGGRLRTVFFSQRAIYWIAKYMETRKDDDPALFINYRNKKKGLPKRLSVRSIERAAENYARLAGLPVKATPHTLRHSYATDLLTHGVDLRLIQEFLGHKNISATQIYTHVSQKKLRDIHQRYHGGKELSD